MTYKSTVNGQSYSDPKYAPENLNFCIIATLTDTAGGRERTVLQKHFPYQWGGEDQAFADAQKYASEALMPKLTKNSEISLGTGARPAHQRWPTT